MSHHKILTALLSEIASEIVKEEAMIEFLFNESTDNPDKKIKAIKKHTQQLVLKEQVLTKLKKELANKPEPS